MSCVYTPRHAGLRTSTSQLLGEFVLLNFARRCPRKVLRGTEHDLLRHLELGEARSAHREHIVFGQHGTGSRNHYGTTDLTPTIVHQPDDEHLADVVVPSEDVLDLLWHHQLATTLVQLLAPSC